MTWAGSTKLLDNRNSAVGQGARAASTTLSLQCLLPFDSRGCSVSCVTGKWEFAAASGAVASIMLTVCSRCCRNDCKLAS